MRVDAGAELLHYRLIEKVGQGGMGVVWRAHDRRLGRDVAIKFLPENFARDPERLARFEREARLLASLNHPGIVTIHAVERVADMRFIVMELLRGRTLEEVIPADGLPPSRFFRLAVPLADAVAAAHRHGIIHRDIKPGNVMVDEDDRIKVLDFGLARPDGAAAAGSSVAETAPPDLTRAGAMMGTAAWMAPEQAEGGAVDHRSDIFSLGAVLYAMATGQRPFTGGSAARIISSILRDDPPPIASIRSGAPPGLDAIVGACIRKEAEARIQSAAELRERLETAARGTGAPGRRGSASASWHHVGGRRARPGGDLWMLDVEGGSDRDGRLEVWVVGAEGSPPRRISDAGASGHYLRWSDDGKQVIFGSGPVGQRRILRQRIDASGEAPERLPDIASGAHFSFSPDRRLLMDVAGHKVLWVRPIDGSAPVKVFEFEDPESRIDYPVWSPDGKWILFDRVVPRGGDIWLLEVAE